jgi:hypothetical protein
MRGIAPQNVNKMIKPAKGVRNSNWTSNPDHLSTPVYGNVINQMIISDLNLARRKKYT